MVKVSNTEYHSLYRARAQSTSSAFRGLNFAGLENAIHPLAVYYNISVNQIHTWSIIWLGFHHFKPAVFQVQASPVGITIKPGACSTLSARTQNPSNHGGCYGRAAAMITTMSLHVQLLVKD